MTEHTPSAQFHDAANYLSNTPSMSNVSNSVKLELYGLFKFLTVSHTPSAPRPSLFNIAGRAKWDAWSSISNTYKDRNRDAEGRYLHLAQSLGWSERSENQDQGRDQKGDWDKAQRNGESGGGMGTAVSTVAVEDDVREKGTLHSLALHGDAKRLQAFVGAHPTTDLNGVDAYGYTPLQLACDRGHRSVVEFLLAQKVDLSIKDPDDLTAVDLARIAEHDDIVTILESASLN